MRLKCKHVLSLLVQLWRQLGKNNKEAHYDGALWPNQTASRRSPLCAANLEALSPRVAGVLKVSPPGAAEPHRAALPLHVACWVCSAGRQAEDAVSLTKADKLTPRFPLGDEKWSRVEVAGCMLG